MVNLNISLSDELNAAAEAQARQVGFSSVNDYVRAIISAGSEAVLPEDWEARAIRGLDSPGKEMTSSDWAEKRAHLERWFESEKG